MLFSVYDRVVPCPDPRRSRSSRRRTPRKRAIIIAILIALKVTISQKLRVQLNSLEAINGSRKVTPVALLMYPALSKTLKSLDRNLFFIREILSFQNLSCCPKIIFLGLNVPQTWSITKRFIGPCSSIRSRSRHENALILT